MGDKLKKFIELYDKQAAQRVALAQSAVDRFKKAREASLELTAPVNDSYKTLGELVKVMFPENGGVDDNLFQNVYAKLILDDSDKRAISSLFKVKNAPNELENSLSLQKQGGEVYLNNLVLALNKTVSDAQANGSTLTMQRLLGNGSEDAKKEFLSVVAIEEYSIKGPAGLQNSTLYEAVLEKQSTVSSKGEPSPINEASEKKKESPTLTPVTSAVNPEKAAESTKTEVESTSGQVTSVAPEVPAEIEKKEAKQTVNINLEAPTARITGPVVSQPTTIVNQGATSTTNVQNVSASNKEEVTQAQTTIAPSTSKTSITGGSSVSQINDLSSKKTEGGSTAISNTTNTASQITNLGKQFGFSEKQLAQIASGQTLNTITEITKKAEKLKETSKTSEISSINEGEEEARTETGKTEPAINEVKSESSGGTGKYAALVETAKRYGINVESMQPKASSQVEEPEGNEEVSTKKEALPQTVEVSKTKQMLPKENKVEPPAQKTQLPVQAATESSVEAIEKSKEPTKAIPEPESKPTSQPTQPSPGLDLSGLENRLMRIEHLLANTLEVKIVE